MRDQPPKHQALKTNGTYNLPELQGCGELTNDFFKRLILVDSIAQESSAEVAL